MTGQRLVIVGRLPGMNEYVEACRCNPYAGNRMKDQAEKHIAQCATASKVRPVHGLVRIHFLWIERDRRRDKDNVSSAGRKFILDVLKPLHEKRNKFGLGIIDGDGWNHIDGFVDEFDVDRHNPRVIVTIEEVK